MKLINKRIGDFVELYNEKCGIANLTVDDISGINREKDFFEPSKQVGNDTSSYKIVLPGYFACNLMHVGRDVVLPISLNTTKKNKVVSPAYTVFKIKDEDAILKEYFFMYLKSSEKDRFFWFHTDSSVRDGLSWEDFCDLEISIPITDIQKKYVKIYNSLLENQQIYESRLDDLKKICNDYVDSKISIKEYNKLGNYIELNTKRNYDGIYNSNDIKGFNDVGDFIKPMRVFSGNINNFRIIDNGDFVYNPRIPTTRFPVALNNSETAMLVSPAYVTFFVTNKNELDPNYLIMIMQRPKFSRKVLYNTWGSSTPFLRHDDLCDIEIPVPDINIQKSLSEIYNMYKARRIKSEKIKKLINKICPLLIIGSINEAKKLGGKNGL